MVVHERDDVARRSRLMQGPVPEQFPALQSPNRLGVTTVRLRSAVLP